MAINLEKGQKINLEKTAPGLTQIDVGLGWKERATDGQGFDLDASCIMLNADGKPLSEKSFVFFDNPTSPCGTIVHSGDNLTDEGEGDDEVIGVNLLDIDSAVQKIIFVIDIHKADDRKQNFGQVDDAYVRIVNKTDGKELCRFDLSEDYSTETLMIMGELYQKGGEWRFGSKGDGFSGGLRSFLELYGLA